MKVGIIGAGLVGSGAANALVLRRVCNEVVLVDLNKAAAEAQAQDILHAAPFVGQIQVVAGDYDALKGCELVIVSAGVNQRPGESRLELLSRNAEVFRAVIPNILQVEPNTLLLIATNPVDVMTQVAAAVADLPPGRVIGSGTVLDTARFRSLLAEHLNVSVTSVHGYVLGEHGDSEVLHWSGARVGTLSLNNYALQTGTIISEADRARIDEGVRGAAAKIIAGKGATWYGIGAGLARLTEIIVRDERSVMTVSMLNENVVGVKDVALSLPRLVGGEGIIATLRPKMTEDEEASLEHSARILKEAADSILK